MGDRPDIPALKFDAGAVTRCRLPPPTRELLVAMAREAAESVRALRVDLPLNGWEDMEPASRDEWITAMEGAYVAIARHAGARPESVPDPRSSM